MNIQDSDDDERYPSPDSSDVDSELEFKLYAPLHYSQDDPSTFSKSSTDAAAVKSDTSSTKEPSKKDDVTSPVETQTKKDDDDVIVILSSSDEDKEDDDDDAIKPWEIIMLTTDKKDDKMTTNMTSSASTSSTTTAKPLVRFFHEDNRQCKNCREMGHIARKCPFPKQHGPCLVCASRTHIIRNCPNRPPFHRVRYNVQCGRCHNTGHLQSDCPENWRQYRLTTTEGVIVKPDGPFRLSKNKSCFNCGARGHFGFQCRRPTMNGCIISTPMIQVYDKITSVVKPTTAAKFANGGKVGKAPKKIPHYRGGEGIESRVQQTRVGFHMGGGGRKSHVPQQQSMFRGAGRKFNRGGRGKNNRGSKGYSKIM